MVFYEIFVYRLLSHVSNKFVPYFIIDMWTFCDNMSFDSTKKQNFKKSLSQPS